MKTSTNPVSLGVAPAAPGIFTADQSGAGQAAAINQDFSPNSAATPAGFNTVVSLFLSGCGSTNPAGRDGARTVSAPPFPEVSQPVQATIGGLPATVFYAGAAPGQLEGLCQINAQVPAGISVGDVPVEIRIGGLPSQAGVTVAVAQAGGGDPLPGGGFGSDPGEIRSCSQLCSGLRDIGGLLDILLGVPSALTQKGDACECFSLLFPTRDY